MERFADEYGSATGIRASELSRKLDAWTKDGTFTDEDLAAAFGKDAQTVKDRAMQQAADLAKVESSRGETKESDDGVGRSR